MHHGGRFVTESGAAGWVLPVAVLAGITLLVALVWVVARLNRADAGSRSAQREVEDNLDGQIMAMLHQSGKPLSQLVIAGNLGLPVQRVAGVLKDLEDKGWVTRRWEADEYSYSVKAPQ